MSEPVTRPLAPALRARLLGSGILVLGVVVLVAVAATWALSLPDLVVTVVVALAVAALLALLGLLLPAHWVVRLDDDGYRVRALRSTQARAARWSDVRDVQAGTVDGVRCTMLRLRDGRTATLPVDAVAGDPEQLTALIAELLDRSRGYRRLR